MKSFVAILIAITAFGKSSLADVIPSSQRNILGWQLAAYDNGRGTFSHCGMYVGYRSGIFMHFAIFANYNWRIGWTHESWNFTPGQKLNISYFVDGSGPHNLSVVALNKSFAIADLPPTAGIFELMRKGYQMTVLAAGNEYRFNLDGTYAALTELAGCVNRFTQVARGATPSMIPEVGPAATPKGTVTADERLEATRVVANILAQGDMTGFRLLSSKEVADLNSEYFSKSDVVWKAEDVIGTLRIISKSAGVSATDIATAVVADDIKNCKGQSASGTTKDERSADIVRMFTACKDGKKSSWDNRYTVVPIGDGSYYLFAMGSPSSAGERGTGAPKADALLREAVYEVMKK